MLEGCRIMKTIDTNYLIVGSGIAGLMSAIHLCTRGRVLLVTKKDRADSNTNYAQGGIACVVSSEDSFEEHIKDTMGAGAGLCKEDVVRSIVSAGPERIKHMEGLGIRFEETEGSVVSGYDLGKEGGHSKRRVLHSGDMTGKEIERVLLARVMAEPNVQLIEHCMMIDLVCTSRLGATSENRCIGAYFLNGRSNEIFAVRAPATILATGGGGKVYLYTSNPDIATADGIAAAWRAGARIANMEFIQFHPTCFYHRDAKSFLISEAVRGEGGMIVDADGHRFVDDYDSRGSLAPRDIVARAIDDEMKRSGMPCVYLDIRDKGRDFLLRRFPNIFSTCLSLGVDMAKDLIPVVPAAHYFCGGVQAGIDGKTSLPGLYACGEVACTGLHGANRLASNSLLEALVCSDVMARKMCEDDADKCVVEVGIPEWEIGDAASSDEQVVVEHSWNEVRTCMWDYVGIVRTNKRLERAFRRIHNMVEEVREYYWEYLVTPDILELRNIAQTGELIIMSAQRRRESRGLHCNLDYPDMDVALNGVDTVLERAVSSDVARQG
jgi:L-aspartate oxidase